MSDVFVQRLRAVRDEYDAAREALSYIIRNWQKHDIYAEMVSSLTPKHFNNAANNLEAIFIIRLFTTFEGILKEHLAKNHPRISVPEDARVVWLIDRVATRRPPHITTQLRVEVHKVRKYRNALVHADNVAVSRIIFNDALAQLAKYCDKLPEPHR